MATKKITPAQLGCRDCGEARTECARCDTAGVCSCCPCECAYVDVSPTTQARQVAYDAAQERRDRAAEGVS